MFLDTRQKVTFDYLGNVIEVTEIVLKLKLLLTSRSILLSKGVPKTDLGTTMTTFLENTV